MDYTGNITGSGYMVYKNAFFQMLIKDAVYIKYFPPREGGAPLNLDELADDGMKAVCMFIPPST